MKTPTQSLYAQFQKALQTTTRLLRGICRGLKSGLIPTPPVKVCEIYMNLGLDCILVVNICGGTGIDARVVRQWISWIFRRPRSALPRSNYRVSDELLCRISSF
jgi:hypothetical protein